MLGGVSEQSWGKMRGALPGIGVGMTPFTSQGPHAGVRELGSDTQRLSQDDRLDAFLSLRSHGVRFSRRGDGRRWLGSEGHGDGWREEDQRRHLGQVPAGLSARG